MFDCDYFTFSKKKLRERMFATYMQHKYDVVRVVHYVVYFCLSLQGPQTHNSSYWHDYRNGLKCMRNHQVKW